MSSKKELEERIAALEAEVSRAKAAGDQPVEIDLKPRVGQGGGVALGGCGWFHHDWDYGTACCTSTTRYTCRACGKVKKRNNGMG